MIKHFLFTLVFFASCSLMAQTISGPTSATVNTAQVYTYNDGIIYPGAGWYVEGGTTSNIHRSGTTYYVTVTWTTVGSGYLTFNNDLASLTVNVLCSCCPPATPIATFSYTASCGSTQITRTGTPPSGVTWYWQTSATGTSTANSTTSYNATTTNTTYYLRPYVSCGAWGTALATNSVTVSCPPTITCASNPAYIALGNTIQLNTWQYYGSNYYSYQWMKAGTDIAGATSPSYTATEPADYSVRVKVSSGSTPITSAVFTVYALGNQPDGTAGSMISTTIRKAGVKPTTNLYTTLQTTDYLQTVQYLDPLSRPLQTVAIGQSPQMKDVVKPYTYDTLQPAAYLPYVTTGKDGSRKINALTSGTGYTGSDQYLFYQQTSTKIAASTAPFAKTVYESSPIGRVLEQGASGTDWQTGTGGSLGAHTVKAVFHTNATAFPVRQWTTAGPAGFYAANTLNVDRTTDENGNPVISYTDKLGNTVLKRVKTSNLQDTTTWLETYYVYDTRGNLALQVPPKASALLNSGTTWTTTLRDTWCFVYTYDVRNRLVQKQVPGQALVYYIYDPVGRLVLTQDGRLRTSNQWAFAKYDTKGRKVMAGVYTNNTQTTLSTVQTLVNGLYTNPATPYYEERGSALHGYTNQSFPATNADGSALQIYSVNYFDNYDFDNDNTPDYNYTAQGITGESTQGNSFGLVTGSKRLVLGTSNWLYTYAFYDRFGKVIQVRSNNHLSFAIDNLTTVIYDFEGKVLQTKAYHNAGGINQYTIVQKNSYDFAGRLQQVYHNINSAATDQLVAQYEYNELGQVVDKKLHNTTGNAFLQSIDYRYNIRGWLSSINNAQLTADGTMNDETTDYFGMELFYNNTETSSLGNSPSYNGNISAIKWKNPGTATGAGDQRSFKYSYDKSDKLLSATFQANTGSGWAKETNTLNESMNYDHNGNILSLTRNQNQRSLSGTTVTSTSQAVDNLTYTYANGNRLGKVEDAATAAGGFLDGAHVNKEYSYDTLGSLTADQNKGISSIVYNVQNKPVTVNFTDGRVINYTYDAAGTKLKMATTVSGTTTTTDYVGGFVYNTTGGTSTLNFFSSPEGRVVKNASGNFEYQYAIADHQGNTRVLFTSATPTAVSTTATFEGDSNDQSSQFSNVTAISFGSANHTVGGSKVVQLNQSTPIGPGLSKKVYPGDKVDMEVYSYYEASSGYGTGNALLTGIITQVTSALVGATGGIDGGGLKSSGVNSALTNFGVGANQGNTAPAAFLNYILFDANYKVMTAGWQVVPASPFTKQQVSLSGITVKEAGYIFVYLSYEDLSNNYVYFDDFKVTVTPTNILQTNEYYSHWSLTANSWTRDNTVNNFLGNGGTELNAASALYDLEFRNFDPILGRMHQIDPMSDTYSSHTPYNYAFNSPVVFNDVNGADPIDDLFAEKFGLRAKWYENDDYQGGVGVWRAKDSGGGQDFSKMWTDAQAVKQGLMSEEEYAAKWGTSYSLEPVFSTRVVGYKIDYASLTRTGGYRETYISGWDLVADNASSKDYFNESGFQQQIKSAGPGPGTLVLPWWARLGVGATVGISATGVAAASLIAALPYVVAGDQSKVKEPTYTYLYRNVGLDELSSFVRKGYNFGFSPGSLNVKEFWMTPDGLAMWQNSNTFAGPYLITIAIPTSIIGPIVQPQFLDGHLAGVVYPSGLNAFNAAKVTISISLSNKICD